jgi:hypothetical protein
MAQGMLAIFERVGHARGTGFQPVLAT